MIQKNENTLQEMLYKKANYVIYYLQQLEQMNIDKDTCLKQIKELYQDTQFLELLNQKNNVK